MARPATLITGASAGLGVEFARQCRARGDTVLLVARRGDRLLALAEELGGGTRHRALDLSQPEQIDALFEWIQTEGLEVDTLINNAGFGLAGAFCDAPAERLLEMTDLNMRALTQLCRRVLPGMVARKFGGILNVASTAAFQAGPYMAVYYATKAYVLSLTEALHQELKGSGVAVTALCPGPVRTEFFDVAGAAGSRLARMGADPAGVVRAGLEGLARNRAIVIPGLSNRVGAQASRILPRAAMRRIIARLKA